MIGVSWNPTTSHRSPPRTPPCASRRALSPVALLESCLARIAAQEAGLRAWVYVDEVGARAAARELETDARGGQRRGPLQWAL